MEYAEIERKLYQIITGTYYLSFDGKEYKSVPNTAEEKHRSNLIYLNALNDIKYENIMSWDDAKIISDRLGIWTQKDDVSLSGLEKMLENLKLDLYNNYNKDPMKEKSYRKQIKSIKTGITRSQNNKHALYHGTKEYFAENTKKQFLLALSLRDIDNNRIFSYNNFWEIDQVIMELFADEVHKNLVPHEDIRTIAHKEPWRTMWLNQHGEAFNIPAIHWTDDQRLLASYSRMYDNVYESMECPPDKVIEDHDMLDGWLINQRREREKKQKEKEVEDKYGSVKNQDGQELFIVANDRNKASEIYNMNNDIGRGVIQTRQNSLHGKGTEVKHQHLPDVQMELKLQATQEMRDRMRNLR